MFDQFLLLLVTLIFGIAKKYKLQSLLLILILLRKFYLELLLEIMIFSKANKVLVWN